MAMELSDYMRRVLRWSWLIAVVTVVGGIIALLLTSQSSTEFVTSATVAPPADVTNAAQAQQYVSDFQASASSRAVQDLVTVETELARAAINERVSVNRVGDSGLVSITYRTPIKDDDRAEPVVESVVQNTLSLMYESRVKASERRVAAAEAAVTSAEEAVTAANAQVNEFLAARGFVSPLDELTSVQDQITQFQIRETEARADGNIAAANTYVARLAELDKRRSDVAKDATAFTALQDDVDAAKLQVGRADTANETAVTDKAEITPEGQTRFGRRGEPQDRTASIWQRTLAVMLACFVLSILLVAWLSSLTPSPNSVVAPEAAPDDVTLDDVALEPEPAGARARSRSSRPPKHDPDGVSVSAQPS